MVVMVMGSCRARRERGSYRGNEGGSEDDGCSIHRQARRRRMVVRWRECRGCTHRRRERRHPTCRTCRGRDIGRQGRGERTSDAGVVREAEQEGRRSTGWCVDGLSCSFFELSE